MSFIDVVLGHDVLEQLDEESLAPWESEKMENCDMEFKLCAGVHSIAKYTVCVNSALEFTVMVFHWPLPEGHTIYTERKRSIRGEGVKERLSVVENSSLCDGLPEDHLTKSVAIDPTSDITHQLPGTVTGHSIPKRLSSTHFEVSVNYRSVDCRVVTDTSNPEDESCCPCSSARSMLERAERKKSKASSTLARSKASLNACRPEKLRATVIETRLKCKTLEDQLEKLQRKIDDEGVSVGDSLEKDLLKIMAGQNLETTPHMKFFWQEQMELLQAKKMGRSITLRSLDLLCPFMESRHQRIES